MKKIVLKVNINCIKCKTDVMKAATKLTGIDEIAVDGEKGTLTVIGNVDPVLLANKVRRIGKIVEVISVGPPKPDPPKPDPPKPNPSKPTTDPKPDPPLPACCNDCQLVAVSFAPYDDHGRFCSIL